MTAETATAPAVRAHGAATRAQPLRRVLWFFPAAFVVETILGGPAGLRAAPSRYILFFATVLSLTLLALRRGRVRPRVLRALLAVLGFLAFNLAWATAIPTVHGEDLFTALAEIRAILVLVPVVFFIAATDAGDAPVRTMQRIVIGGATVLATLQVVIWAAGTLAPAAQLVIRFGLGWLYRYQSMYIGHMPDGFYRVFWICTLWEMVALFWLPSLRGEVRARGLRALILSAGLLVSYSRGLWLATGLGGITFLVLRTRLAGTIPAPARLVRRVVVGAAGITALAAAAGWDQVSIRLTSAFNSQDVSVSERLRQLPYLLDLWDKSPIFGNGYGAYAVQHVRDVHAPFSYEYTPAALLAKLGLIGSLVFWSFFIALMATAVALAGRRQPLDTAVFAGALVAVLASSLTNPLMINFVGMTIIGCLVIQWASLVAGPPPARGADG
ncbi:MAG TPA: O-antigen ligase family protein [Gemmatimonadales bacterium]|nr:O-antigen ligase family protein [Gemmatimonadales bacterium]